MDKAIVTLTLIMSTLMLILSLENIYYKAKEKEKEEPERRYHYDRLHKERKAKEIYTEEGPRYRTLLRSSDFYGY